jgi:hypothetical protein
VEHGLPVLKNVLLPKTKGFNCCLQELRSSIDAGNFAPTVHGKFYFFIVAFANNHLHIAVSWTQF